MKFFVAAISTAAMASAAAISQRDFVVYSVSDFSAGCIPHSSQCSYEFTVLRPNSMETTGVNCSILATASPAGTLPDVTGGTCEQSSRTFTVTRNDTGLTLSVTQPDTPSSNLTGAYTLPSDELVYSDEPNAVVESYTGPTSFDLNYVPVIN